MYSHEGITGRHAGFLKIQSLRVALPLLGVCCFTLFGLMACMTPTAIVDTGRSLKMMSWSNNQQHYQDLMNQGKYAELVEEYEKELDESRKKAIRAPQIEMATKISGLYVNNLKDYSRAVEYGEMALNLIQEGERMGPENEADENFYPIVSPQNREMYGPEWVKEEKTNWYRLRKMTAVGNMWNAYRLLGDTKKAAYYQREMMKYSELYKKTAGKTDRQLDMQRRQQAYMEKRYGIKQQPAESQNKVEAQLKKHQRQADEMAEKTQNTWAEMERMAAQGDTEGLRKTLTAYLDTMYKGYSQTGATGAFLNAARYSLAADLSYKYGLYKDAHAYSLKGLKAIDRTYEFYRAQAEQAFFTSDRERMMAQHESTQVGNQIKCWLLAGSSLNRLGRYREAIPFLTKVVGRQEVGHGMYGSMSFRMLPKMKAQQELASAYEHLDMNSRAIETYGHMIDGFEGLRAKLTKDTHKISFMGTQSHIYDRIIELLLNEGRLSEAFEYSERARARAFIDLLAGREFVSRDAKTKILLADKKSLETQLANFEKQASSDSSKQRSIQIVTKKITSVNEGIEHEDAELLSMTTVKTLSVKKLQSMLDADTVFVEYYLTRDGLTAWVITSRNVHVQKTDIPVWALAEKIINFRQAVSSPREVPAEASRYFKKSRVRLEISPKTFKAGETHKLRVYAHNTMPLFLSIDRVKLKTGDWTYSVQDTIEKEIPGNEEKLIVSYESAWKLTPATYQVIVETDQGDLASNNVTVHVDSGGVVTVEDQGYAQQSETVTDPERTYSDTSLYDVLITPVTPFLNKKKLLLVPHGILHYIPFAALHKAGRCLIEDYVVSYLPSATVLRFCREKRKKFTGNVLAFGNPDLGDSSLDIPFALDEVRAIKKLYPSATVLAGKHATESAFTEQAAMHDVLHLASHGVFDPDRPLDSALLLSPGSGKDGKLTVNEIFDLRLNASMITLSACQSGMSRIRAGDETLGLPRAFIFAGTPTVIASLWNVNDEATARLMENLYANLKTLSPSQALRQAQLSMRENPRYKQPFYWAAFCLIGE